MQHWILNSKVPSFAVDGAATCNLVSSIGSPDRTMLASSILGLVGHDPGITDCISMAFDAERNPRLISAASRTNTWQLFNGASEYSRELFRRDHIQRDLCRLVPAQDIGCVVAHQLEIRRVADPDLRRFCQDIGIVDGMSVTVRTGRRQWVTTSFHRRKENGLFTSRGVERVLQLAPLIALSTARHCDLEPGDTSEFQSSVSNRLDKLCPRLAKREREVILRVLDGLTAERIASELGVKESTVITYRERAYEKLGIASKRELFVALLHSAVDDDCRPDQSKA